MKNKAFLLINFFGSALELFLLCLIIYIHMNWIVVVFALILYLVVYIRVIYNLNKETLFEEVQANEKLMEKCQPIIDKAIKIKGKHINVKFIKIKEIPNPAFYVRNTVYINTLSNTDNRLLEGILAHELGHAITGLGDVANYVVLKASTNLSNILFMLRFSIKDSKNLLFKLIDFIFYLLFLAVNLVDIIIIHPFLRQDEYKANSYALELTNGKGLRAYYYKAYITRDSLKMKYDLKHPNVLTMMRRMEEKMDLSDIEQKVYGVEDAVIFIDEENKMERKRLQHLYYLNIAPKTIKTHKELAKNYERAIGVELNIEQAIEEYKFAYELGEKTLDTVIVRLYKRINEMEKALPYLEHAADRGKLNALFDLGIFYYNKEYYLKAQEYFQRGMDLKDSRSRRMFEQIQAIISNNTM